MPKLSGARQAKIAARTVKNMIVGRPITVSFEITYNCNANCKHCDLGHYVKEPRMEPEAFAKWLEDLKPVVAQIFVVTTNVQLLNEEKYLKLREAGIDQWSFSLDYPDERHNEFRSLKNNFEHIRDLCQAVRKYDNNDILLACVVQSDNFRDLPKIAQLAKDWGVGCNFSTYNSLRTDNTDYLISKPDDQKDLEKIVDQLVKMQREGYPIMTSEWTMRQMIEFFKTSRQPDCKAGSRFMIVNPWAKLTPCGMFREQFDSQKELNEKFAQQNTCELCFTAIRANSEKSPYRMLSDALRVVRQK